MADELDKFVLQYQVELKDSIKRLEQLNNSVDKVNKQTDKSKTGFKTFANGAADELGKVLPGLDKVTQATRLMGGQFAVAALAVAALGAGIKMAMNTREMYNRQRQEGMDMGMSAVRVEDYRRKFARHSGGRVSDSVAMSQLQMLRDKEKAAYADPQRTSQEARMFNMLGINIGAPGKGSISTTEMLGQFGARLQAMDPARRQGWARANGFDQNFIETASTFGSQLGQMTDTTASDLESRKTGDDAVNKFNDAMARADEQFKELEQTISNKLLPALTPLVQLFGKMAAAIPNKMDKTVDALDISKSNIGREGFFKGSVDNVMGTLGIPTGEPGKKGGWRGGLLNGLMDYFKPKNWDELEAKKQQEEYAKGHPEEARKKADAEAAALAEKKKADQEKVEAEAAAQDANNKAAQQQEDQFALTMNMFAGAVATFANAVDERQAWAAWAGEVGHAAGLGSDDKNTPGGDGTINGDHVDPTAPSKYDPIFKKASEKTGVPMDLLKRITGVESHFDPKQTSEQGAQGLMQVMPSNFKSLGITNGYDPEQNIMGGAKLMKEYLSKATSVREALMMYHGGYDRSGWGARTYAYPGKVLGDASIDANYGNGKPISAGETPVQQRKGQSRESLQLKAVQQNVAARLGISWEQLAMGGATKGDVAFALSQMKAGVQNNIQSLGIQAQQAMLPPMARAKILNEQRNQESGLMQLNTWGGKVVDGSQEGGRSITVGERAIVINVNGTQHPEAVGKAVNTAVQGGLDTLANANATAVKR